VISGLFYTAVAALLCFLQSQSYAAEAARYVLIDARSASDSELADVFTAVAASSTQIEWRTVTVSPSEDMTEILGREYNLTRSSLELYPATNEAMRAIIKAANPAVNIDLVPLLAGPILLPPVPSIPNWGTAQPDLVQVQVKGQRYFVTRLHSLLSSSDKPLQVESKALRDAGTIALLDRFQEQLQKQSRTRQRHLYMGVIKDLRVNLLSETNGCSTSTSEPIEMSVPASIRDRVSQIPDSAAGNIYILDFDLDASECSHGKKVRDVVIQLLKTYGAKHLANEGHVKTIELNYYAHPLQARETLSTIVDTVLDNSLYCEYGRLFAESFGATLDSCDEKLTDVPLSATVDEAKQGTIPGFFLWLLFEYVLDSSSNASVVTSSFYTFSDGFDIATSEKLRQWPALVAAVLNPDRFPPQYANELTGEQPLKQFFIKHDRYGTFLVGALLRDASPFGMIASQTDDDSDAVTAFALGEGYGTKDPNTGCFTSCIVPENKGTSFAAPAVAVQLYLARALWRSEAFKTDSSLPSIKFGSTDDTVSVMEAKRRLALSASVDPVLVGKASAAGIPLLERFVAPAGDVLVTADNTIKQGVVTDARVKVKGLVLDYNDRQHGFGGIQVHGGHTFVYDEATKAWRQADDAGFYVRLQDGTEYSDPASFAAAYNSIAKYK
jgi:hypothetical protein